MSLYIGIDVGGTSIKGALIDGEGKLYGEDCVRTGNGVEIVDGIQIYSRVYGRDLTSRELQPHRAVNASEVLPARKSRYATVRFSHSPCPLPREWTRCI